MVPVPVGVNTYLGNRQEYTKSNVQDPYIAMLPDSYIPLMGPELKLFT